MQNVGTLETYQAYIEDLYCGKGTLRREEFVNQTSWKDFVPVIEDDSARFLKLILQMKKPKSILEIGTSIGFSAVSMALTAREYGGRITTIEFNKTAAEQAKLNFERFGVQNIIQIKLGDASKIVPNLSDSAFDFVFQDVDNRLYPALLKDCIRILKTGGILIADDTLFPAMKLGSKWKDQVEPIHEFNRMIAAATELESTLLPVGDGMVVAVKK